ncbi:Putative heterokaryon incompatibility [Septoria linicola]|uniref:Heterokaryon incompatibility n=1 Tax=Septoria linicola TaxID=215465 RepID=A0A9Q9ANL3_9PEZI|nr:putative heterokaryon incompatibility [Septoria linicola]USW52265.1 Putative heterokaryon incompatibility [Septoria linicola]
MQDDEDAWHCLCSKWQQNERAQARISATSEQVVAEKDVFSGAPLLDPAKQIRLLRFLSTPKAETIVCKLEVFSLDDLPAYANFSYTWGFSSETKTIIINGQPFDIGVNCHYALRQVSSLPHAQLGHFWIDSICVNQAEVRERSEQVTIMGSIYSKASIVLVCLGLPADDSDYLLQTLAEAEWSKLGVRSTKTSVPEIERQLTGNGSAPDGVHRFMTALDEFGRREYWKRLWIIQEITLAQNVLMLCGDCHIGLHRFITAVHAVRHCGTRSSSNRTTNRINLPRHIAHALQQALPCPRNQKDDDSSLKSETARLTLLEALQKFGTCHCKDVRDRVYGLRSIIKWPHDLPQPVTDYSISTVDLALQLLPLLSGAERGPLSAQVLLELIKALELTPEQARMMSNSYSCEQSFKFSGRACRLTSDGRGGLTADLRLDGRTRALHKLWHEMVFDTDASSDAKAVVPIRITGDVLAAIASPQARHGDILFRAYPFWLVIRHNPEADLFEIVGQVWMGSAQLCSNDTKTCQCKAHTGFATPYDKHLYATFMAVMSFEDLCVLEAHRRRAGFWRPHIEIECNRESEYLSAAATSGKLSSYAVMDERCDLMYDVPSCTFVTRSGADAPLAD